MIGTLDNVRLTRDFELWEFADRSHRELTLEEEAKAKRHAVMHLQPARREVGRIRITSFVRTGSAIGGGTHANGDGVDIVPLDTSMDALFAWYLRNPWAYGQVIHEGDHLHVTLPGVRGKQGEVLIMDAPGNFRFGLAWLPLLPALAFLSGLLLLAWVL